MFKIVIPSYNRQNIIKEKTLKLLKEILPNKKIFVFTPQPNLYILDDNIEVIECQKGLINARNEIMDYFEENENLLFIDDDIDDIINLNKYDSIEKEILRSFDYMKRNNIYLGGFNPTHNKRFSSGNYKKGLYFCVGSCYLLINDKYFLKCEDELEDYYRSIKYYLKDGLTFRNDLLLIKTKYEKNKGGMYSIDRYNNKTRRSIELIIEFPNYFNLVNKKNYYGLKMIKSKKNIIVNCHYRDVGEINGKYSNKNLCILQPNKNYIFKDNNNNNIIGLLFRNVYKLDEKFNFKVRKDNNNCGDIAGIIQYDKLPCYVQKQFNELKFNKQKTTTIKTENHKFTSSNCIKRSGGIISENEVINNIFKKVKAFNIFNNMCKYVVNHELISGFHKDHKNKNNYVLLLTKNNNLFLEIPEYNLVVNNLDGDVLIFNAKKYFHGNNEGDNKNRYSIIFFE